MIASIAGFLALYALFDVLPIVLPKDGVIEDVRWGDLADAPLLFGLIAAFVWLGRQAHTWRSSGLFVANGLALALLAQGHGIHMAANTISSYTDPASPAWRSAYFLDEHWGHAELHIGILFEAAIFVTAATALPGRLTSNTNALVGLLAAIFGLFLTADAIEGQTVPLMLPAGALLALLLWQRRGRGPTPYATFFGVAGAVLVLALIGYGLWHGGSFPEHDWHVWQVVTEGPSHCC